jgi:hypothetical protein
MKDTVDNKIIDNEMASDKYPWPEKESENTTAEYLYAVVIVLIVLGLMAIGLASLAPKPAQAKLGDYAGNTSTTRYMDDKDEMYKRIHDLEVATDQLQQQNRALEAKIGAVSIPKQETIVKEVQTQTVVQDEARMVAIEKRVSVLEQAYNFIQKNVMDALSKTIGLLTKLLSK